MLGSGSLSFEMIRTLVDRIDGDFFNVMGLPVPTFLRLLRAAGHRYAYGRIECTEAQDT